MFGLKWTAAARRFSSNAASVDSIPKFIPRKQFPFKQYLLRAVAVVSGTVSAALMWEYHQSEQRMRERILSWQTIPDGALFLPDCFVEQKNVVETISHFVRSNFQTSPNPSTADSSASTDHALCIYGSSHSGKSSALRSVVCQLIRESLENQKKSTTPKHSTEQIKTSMLPANQVARVVYFPFDYMHTNSRRISELTATVLDYRPMYFFLKSLMPQHLRFGSATNDFAAALECLRSTCEQLQKNDNVSVLVCFENLHRIHKRAAQSTTVEVLAPDLKHDSVKLTEICVDWIKRTSVPVAFTCSSAHTASHFQQSVPLLKLHHQTEFTLNEARQLAQMKLEQRRERVANVLEIRKNLAEKADQPVEAPKPKATPQPLSAPQHKSVHPDFLFSNSPFTYKKVKKDANNTDSTATTTANSEPQPSTMVMPEWNEEQFHRVVSMIGLSPILIRSAYSTSEPVEQAKRALAAKLLAISPYIFTNNFAIEDSWAHGGATSLRNLLVQRCNTSALLESAYLNSPKNGLVCAPGKAISDASVSQCRRTAQALCPSNKSTAKPVSGSDNALELSSHAIAMLDSGILDLDLSTNRLRFGTIAHQRAYERLRARQSLVKPYCSMVATCDEKALIETSETLSLTLASNMWL